MYDTLMQMGRWFGYRPNYDDLVKVWMSYEAIDWYGQITRATAELKEEIAKMRNAHQTPREFGLKVRQDPGALIVTARNKMRTATDITCPVTVSGNLLETPRLKSSRDILAENEKVFKDFVYSLAETVIVYMIRKEPKIITIGSMFRVNLFHNYYWILTRILGISASMGEHYPNTSANINGHMVGMWC